jgi:hypothetical protein
MVEAWLGLGLVVVALLALFFVARRATTVCALSVRNGTVEKTYGDLAPGILGDLRDVLAAPRTSHGTIRITRSGGRAQVTLRGKFTDAQAQQVRNVVGSVPLARLASARARGL